MALTDALRDALEDTVRRLVDDAIGTCEPENADEKATAHTRKVLTSKFAATLSRANSSDVSVPRDARSEQDTNALSGARNRLVSESAVLPSLCNHEGNTVMLEDKSGAELGLAPCPFCGSDSEHIWLRHKNVHRSSTCTEIQCECCGAIGPVWSAVELDGEEYDAEIIAQWNRTNEPTVKLPLSASPQAKGDKLVP